MNEGQRQREGNKAAQHTLFVYSKGVNKKESQRIPFYRNPKPPLYQSRIAEMKKNFKAAPVKRAVTRTVPKPTRRLIEHETKATITLKHDTVHTANTCNDDALQDLMFPDDLEVSFCSGQLDVSKRSEMPKSSTVPDINSSTHEENIESQEFYQLPTPSKSNVKRKRTYRDFPNYTYKKPYYSSS